MRLLRYVTVIALVAGFVSAARADISDRSQPGPRNMTRNVSKTQGYVWVPPQQRGNVPAWAQQMLTRRSTATTTVRRGYQGGNPGGLLGGGGDGGE
jgi:hypothetical protein